LTQLDNLSMTSPFDAIRHTDERGDYWLAREVMPLLGYDKWERFEDAIERAMISATTNGFNPEQAFSRIREEGTGGRPRLDYRLTKHAAYLTAMNGDVRKDEVAAAQTYFAAKTHEAEIADQRRSAVAPLSRAEMARRWYEAERDLEESQAQVAELAPAAKSWNVLASAEGDYSVADAAKILSRDPAIQLGERRLFSQLRELGWVYRQRSDNRWRSMQTAVEAQRLSEIPASHYHPRTGALVLDAPQLRVTQKGLHELHRRLGGVQPLATQLQLVAIAKRPSTQEG
jgi:DNA-damage-inducible protein D